MREEQDLKELREDVDLKESREETEEDLEEREELFKKKNRLKYCSAFNLEAADSQT